MEASVRNYEKYSYTSLLQMTIERTLLSELGDLHITKVRSKMSSRRPIVILMMLQIMLQMTVLIYSRSK